MRITDRKKDLIVTAGGKKVAPQKLEALVMRDPLFSQVVALGDKKPYIVALLVLNRTIAMEEAAKLNLTGITYEDLIQNSRFRECVLSRVHQQTTELARFESIKAVAIVSQDFSVQGGELTPTLKVKRRFVMDKYAVNIDALYQQGVAHTE